MFCNSMCGICQNPCFRGEFKPITKEEEKGASKAFDSALTSSSVVSLQNEEETPNETGLSVIENIGTYELKTNIFGKQKVRKVK